MKEAGCTPGATGCELLHLQEPVQAFALGQL